ncbi:MAG: (Fe-S)-binding protein [Actinomycetes bacterium]
MAEPVPAFDAHRPPAQDIVDDCVHCGFCLPTCPTYVLWGEEMDSPRGRIHLIDQGLQGGPLSGAMVEHVDRCLGCMACVTACPSGVRYDRLIEDTRAQVERRHDRSRGERLLRAMVFALFPHPRRLRAMRPLLRAYRLLRLDRAVGRLGDRLPGPLRAMADLMPPIGRDVRLPARVAAHGDRRAVAGLLTGCVQAAFFPDVNAATARVLAREGCEVVVPPGQGCCGALALHVGREDEAKKRARRTIEAFEESGVDVVVVNAAGCGSAMKEYGELLRDDPEWAPRAAAFAARVRDVTEVLAGLAPRATYKPLPVRAAYQDACHLAHAQGVRSQPRDVLRRVPDLELVEIAEPELCCGSAGVYNLLQPEAARELGDRKAGHIAATDSDVVVTGNPGCLLQITAAARRRGEAVRVVSTSTLLDASQSGASVARLIS